MSLLQAIKGLDPGLPHYSLYVRECDMTTCSNTHRLCSRWLIPLLTHTLPLPAVLMVWDALFSQPMRQRDVYPKLDYLVDVCTSMLLCARGTLLQYVQQGVLVIAFCSLTRSPIGSAAHIASRRTCGRTKLLQSHRRRSANVSSRKLSSRVWRTSRSILLRLLAVSRRCYKPPTISHRNVKRREVCREPIAMWRVWGRVSGTQSGKVSRLD